MKMWVFRITKGYSFDDPIGPCPIDVDLDRVKKVIGSNKKTPIVFSGDVKWVQNELYQGRLRQGWGVPGLDLRLDDAEWTENYLIACCKYWGGKFGETKCSEAMGRKRILDRMKMMNVGNIIFIPKTPTEQEFMAATVSKKYYFDEASYPGNDFRNNFRHIIEVEKLKSYPNSVLDKGVFGSPFMHAIDPIEPHFKVYGIFNNFKNKYFSERE